MKSRLFYQNQYMKEFTAKVLECIPMKKKKNFGIILNRTCFYPEGGGQPGDKGKLDEIDVIDTQKIHETKDGIKQDKIVHIVKNAIEIGKEIRGKIDWERRFNFMQAHTAQHLISEVLLNKWNIATLSVHFGENSTSIDIKRDNLTWKDVNKLEKELNTAIFENHPVEIHWITNEADLTKFPLRKKPTKKDKLGYRIVVIKDLDYSPCGGTHLRSTGELGIIKISKWTRVKTGQENGLRMEFLTGWKALEDYQNKAQRLSQSLKFLGIAESELFESVKRNQEEIRNQKHCIQDLEAKLGKYLVQDFLQNADLIPDSNAKIVHHIFEDTGMKPMRDIATQIIEEEKSALIIFANRTKEKANLLFIRNSEYFPEINLSSLLRETAEKLGGKGGGKPNFAQGGGNSKNLNKVFTEIVEKIKKML
ncbi:MAG: alanyl-tRNA editing protein [Promethearchaeota archaeon]